MKKIGIFCIQEHKTDEMHTALMEASMDGHVEVARLLLDSGAQVNMPADRYGHQLRFLCPFLYQKSLLCQTFFQTLVK